MTEINPDIVIVGSGVGGSAVAHQLAGSGARILILERGDFLPKEPQNSDADAVFIQSRYRTKDIWQDSEGCHFRPGQYYFVGGHTKFYGTAMFRFRERDFHENQLDDGISPGWPFSYDELEPYYTMAEELFGVRGQAGDDPTEPVRSGAYPHAAIPHEPIIANLANGLSRQGLHPFKMPSAIDFGTNGTCRRCGTCDAFACRFDAKGDAETKLLRPTLRHANVTLWKSAQVMRLIPDENGQRIVAAEVLRGGERLRVKAPLFILSAGAINSALILLRSKTHNMPEGLANRSGVVGRYLMNHHLTGLMGIWPFTHNKTRFPKTMSVNDFYNGLPGDPMARGNIQMLGNISGPMISSVFPQIPKVAANWLGRHSVDFLAMSEDPPNRESRVLALEDGGVQVSYRPRGIKEHDRFVNHVKKTLRQVGFPMVIRHRFGIESPSHQCGTVRMGYNPNKSALNDLCQAHSHPNLFVVDAGFFPSSAALNPALTVAAQALRVGANLRSRWRNDMLMN